MTGWGQDGPWSHVAGHDMNYVATAGALHGLGQDRDRPHFPGNLLGDFGGGSTYLVVGVLAALLEARTSGQGQVVDAAIVDGTAHLNAMAWTFAALGATTDRRRSGLLDGGTPWYDLYETADGQHMSVGALEPQFWAELVARIGVELPDRDDPANHATIRGALVRRFRERTQAEWSEVFDGTDACVAAVVPLTEAPQHPHLAARGTYVERDGVTQPAPAPRFSRTGATFGSRPARPGEHTREALAAWGIDDVDAPARQRRGDAGGEALPLPRHPRRGRRRPAGARRRARRVRPAPRRAGPRTPRGRPARRGRPRRLLRASSSAAGRSTCPTPRTRSPRSSAAPRPSCTPSP